MSNTIKPFKNKGECLPLETNDMTAVLDIVISSVKQRAGRPAEYEYSPAGLEQFINTSIGFFEKVKAVNENPDIEKKLIPDIENWCVFLGITRTTLLTYSRRDQEWAQVIDTFKTSIMSCKKQLALTYKMPPMVFVFDSVNNHGYLNSSEYHITPEPTRDTLPTYEDILRRLPKNDDTEEPTPQIEDKETLLKSLDEYLI